MPTVFSTVTDFNNIETRDVTKIFFSLQGKSPKEIHSILTETLACFLPGRAKHLSAPPVHSAKIEIPAAAISCTQVFFSVT